jgi:hypothetical protein
MKSKKKKENNIKRSSFKALMINSIQNKFFSAATEQLMMKKGGAETISIIYTN